MRHLRLRGKLLPDNKVRVTLLEAGDFGVKFGNHAFKDCPPRQTPILLYTMVFAFTVMWRTTILSSLLGLIFKLSGIG